MDNHKLILKAVLSALGVLLYILLVAWFITGAESFFDGVDSFFGPVIMLLTLVLSAAVTGLLVFGAPAHMYFGEHKKEAIILLIYTLVCLVILLVIFVGTLVFVW